jgi:hypothetical protein
MSRRLSWMGLMLALVSMGALMPESIQPPDGAPRQVVSP